MKFFRGIKKERPFFNQDVVDGGEGGVKYNRPLFIVQAH